MRQIRETYIFPNEPEALAYEAYIHRRYPELGYGTKTNVRAATGLENGAGALPITHALEVERWNSCD